ncbi:MAG TPA: sensor histidine kinase [Gaiellaceae bacterium]|nr:sensor histidine kinase [Gaiellaceae bacterium]
MRVAGVRSPTIRVEPERLDLAVAALLTVAAQLEVWLGNGNVSDHHQLVTAVVSAFTTLSVAVRRRWPLQAGVAVGWVVAVELAVWGDPQIIAASVAYFCALYGLTAWTSRREFLLGVGLLLIPLPLDALAPHGPGGSSVLFTAVTLVVMLLIRVVLGDRERRVQFAERERDLAAREAIVSERARIARELHDVVAHSVSVMVVQAQAGPRLVADPEQASGVFSSIEATGREALVELRRLLGVLRSGDEHAATAPQPGLESLDTLLGQVRDTGLRVDLRIEGDPVALPAGVDLSAYRIVQEALTNTLKHAGRAEAEVIVRYDTGFVELEILDNGVGPQAQTNGSGHGIAGMRERVALYGGALETGSRNGHGFGIRARLPLAAEPVA